MKRFLLYAGLLLTVAAASAPGSWRSESFWLRFASPGPLSAAHASLSDDCSACHVRMEGAAAERCVGCHAAERALLQRQSTAFHADIGHCARCHQEHDAARPVRSRMDHVVLARLGERAGERPPRRALLRTLSGDGPATSATAALDCYSCHQSRDRHAGLLGEQCSACHGTDRWFIGEFRHPSANSIECAQCHAPPPSHHMEHFVMVSQNVAGRSAGVEHCFQCHWPTSWNDIRGVGVYDHH
jgi:hypothetical protein